MKSQKTIRGKMYLLVFLQICISVLFILYTICMSAYQNYNDLSNQYFQSGEQMLAALETTLARLSNATLYPVHQTDINSDNILVRALREKSFQKNYKLYQYFNQTARSLISSDGADFIAIYDLNQNGVAIQRGNSEYRTLLMNDSPDWYNELNNNKSTLPRTIPTDKLTGTGMLDVDQKFICQIRNIMDVRTFQIVGICLSGVSIENLEKKFRQIRLNTAQTYTVYKDGSLLFYSEEHNNRQLLSLQNTLTSSTTKNEQYKFITQQNKTLYLFNVIHHKSGYTIVLQTPFFEVLGESYNIYVPFSIIITLILLLMITLIVNNIRQVNTAMNCLINACDSFELNNSDEIVNATFPKEIQILFEAFNRMSSRINHLVQEVFRKQQEQQETEMQLLRAQINPHFLYNTLELIHMQALIQGNTDVADMAELLGQNLQYGLRNTNREVTLREELDQVRIYMKILSYQFDNRVKMNLLVSDDLLDCKIIKLLIQPIIENSVIHGITSSDQILHIELIGFVEDEMLVIQISDDGCGIKPEVLEQLKTNTLVNGSFSNGIGLRNVCRRILLKYGKKYQADIRSEINIGSTVTLYLPYRKNYEIETKGVLRV